MFSLSYILFSLIGSLIYTMWPIILIILIVSLIVRSNGKKTEYGRVHPGEVLMDEAQAVQDKHDNNRRLNILLYLGSFFIAGSMILLAKDAPEIMPVILILVTLLVYGAGIILFRTIDYLRPVAIAFTYTGLVLFPIWYYAFLNAGLPSYVSLVISSVFSCVSSIGATIAIDSRVAGYLSYIWLIISGWAFGSAIDSINGSSTLSTYAFFIWPIFVGIAPNIFWSFRVRWLPLAFRKATKLFAELLTPFFTGLALFTLLIPNMGSDLPALRTIVGALATCNGLISYLSSKKRGHLTQLRLYAQFFIVALTADVTNYSLINFWGNKNIGADLAMVIVWLTSFLAQSVISLFIPQRDGKEKSCERGMLVASLIGVFSTTLFCLNFDQTPRAIALIAIALVVAILGVLIGWRNRDVRWSIATIIATLFIPLEIGNELVSQRWDAWIFFAIYAILTLIYIFAFTLIPLFKQQKGHSDVLLITAIALGNFACLCASLSKDWVEAGWLTSAVDVALAAWLTHRYSWFEGATYLGALSLYSLFGNLMSRGTSLMSLDNATATALAAIRIHVLALPLLGFGFVKERNHTGSARVIAGYLLYTLSMFTLASSDSYHDQYLWSIIFIIEEVAFVLAGIFTKRNWMTITSAIFAALITLDLTGGLNSIWLLIIGVSLIGFVGWQLAKGSKKPQQ